MPSLKEKSQQLRAGFPSADATTSHRGALRHVTDSPREVSWASERWANRTGFFPNNFVWRLAWPLELATDQLRAVVDDRSIVTVIYIPYRTRNWSNLVTTALSTPEKAYRTQSR